MASMLTRFESSEFLHLKSLVYAASSDNEEAFHIALWMSVRVSATTQAPLNECGGQ
jgi:hypothetical protein